MRKTTVYLPDEQKAALTRLAKRTRHTESAIIRDGLALVLEWQEPPPQNGIFDSREPSLSERVDELLADFKRP